MLKITEYADAGTVGLKLEGRLTIPWIEELARCWQQMSAQENLVLIDLTDVTFIGPEGKALLARMWQRGARFQTAGCLNASILDEITHARSVEPSDRHGNPSLDTQRSSWSTDHD